MGIITPEHLKENGYAFEADEFELNKHHDGIWRKDICLIKLRLYQLDFSFPVYEAHGVNIGMVYVKTIMAFPSEGAKGEKLVQIEHQVSDSMTLAEIESFFSKMYYLLGAVPNKYEGIPGA